jgi:hypothetical protein
VVSQRIKTGFQVAQRHTWVSNADSNVSSLELGSIESQCLFKPFQSSELCISEPLRLVELLVLNNSDIGYFAASKEIGNVSNCGIKRKVSEMNSIRWLIGKGEFLTDGVTCATNNVSVLKSRSCSIASYERLTSHATASICTGSRAVGSALSSIRGAGVCGGQYSDIPHMCSRLSRRVGEIRTS